MGLFSTLTLTKPSETVTAPQLSRSLALPTVLQMYVESPYQFETVPATQIASYALLTYQAVPVLSTAEVPPTPDAGLRSKKKENVAAPPPDLGVWNVRVMDSITAAASSAADSQKDSLTDLLMQIPDAGSIATFCWAVDLGKLSTVEPTIASLQNALIRYLIHRQHNHQNAAHSTNQPDVVVVANQETWTTTLYHLRMAQFGLAPEDTSKSTDLTSTGAPEDRQVCIALQICAEMPVAVHEDYHEQQALSLIVYHLRRYAAAVNATLVFVRSKDDSASDALKEQQTKEDSKSAQQQPALTLQQLSHVWRDLASGKRVWKQDEVPELVLPRELVSTPEADADATPVYSLIYGPGTHNEELIESVLLRNAHYPGHWDAAKDSVWKVLEPPPVVTRAAAHGSALQKAKDAGDSAWLAELRDSVAVAEPSAQQTPPRNKREEAADASLTPNDKDVSSFFEGLLKTN